MVVEKIEPRLLDEIRSVETSGQLEYRIPVIIQLDRGQVARSDSSAEKGYEAVEEQVRSQQQLVRQHLADLGAGGVRQITLANALETELTPAQIRAVSSDAQVKRIVLNREDRVAI